MRARLRECGATSDSGLRQRTEHWISRPPARRKSSHSAEWSVIYSNIQQNATADAPLQQLNRLESLGRTLHEDQNAKAGTGNVRYLAFANLRGLTIPLSRPVPRLNSGESVIEPGRIRGQSDLRICRSDPISATWTRSHGEHALRCAHDTVGRIDAVRHVRAGRHMDSGTA